MKPGLMILMLLASTTAMATDSDEAPIRVRAGAVRARHAVGADSDEAPIRVRNGAIKVRHAAGVANAAKAAREEADQSIAQEAEALDLNQQ